MTEKPKIMSKVKDECQKVIMPKRLMPVTKVLPNLYGSYLPATSGLHFSKAHTSVELSNSFQCSFNIILKVPFNIIYKYTGQRKSFKVKIQKWGARLSWKTRCFSPNIKLQKLMHVICSPFGQRRLQIHLSTEERHSLVSPCSHYTLE